MHRVRRRQIGLGLDLGALDHLVQARRLRVGAAVDDVQVGRADPGHDQIAPFAWSESPWHDEQAFQPMWCSSSPMPGISSRLMTWL